MHTHYLRLLLLTLLFALPLAGQANHEYHVLAAAYGAQCDWNGTTGTDDTAAIRAAINAAKTASPVGTVVLPGRKCAITATGLNGNAAIFALTNGVVIEGQHPNNSGLVLMDSTGSPPAIVFEITAGHSATLRNFSLQGRQHAQYPTSQYQAIAHLGTSGDLRLSSVKVEKFDVGIKFYPGSGLFDAHDCDINDMTAHGMTPSGTTTLRPTIRIRNNRFDLIGSETYTIGAAIYVISPASQVLIHGNQIKRAGTGITLKTASPVGNDQSSYTVTDNWLWEPVYRNDSGGGGIVVSGENQGAYSTVIANNHIFDTHAAAPSITVALPNTVVANNVIENLAYSGTTAIFAMNNGSWAHARDITLNGNQIRQTGGLGIMLQNVPRAQILGNAIAFTSTSSGATNRGVYLYTAAGVTDTTVDTVIGGGNSFTMNGGSGILVGSGVDRTHITGNYFSGTTNGTGAQAQGAIQVASNAANPSVTFIASNTFHSNVDRLWWVLRNGTVFGQNQTAPGSTGIIQTGVQASFYPMVSGTVYQTAVLHITKSGSQLQHRFIVDTVNTSTIGPFLSRINGASATLSNTSYVSPSIGFNAGAGIDDTNRATIRLDTAAQAAGESVLNAAIVYNGTATPLTVNTVMVNTDVAGTSIVRPALVLRKNDGTDFSIDTLTSGQSIYIRIEGWLR